jgi:hypothetical protein
LIDDHPAIEYRTSSVGYKCRAGTARHYPTWTLSIAGGAQAELGRKNAVPKQELGNEKEQDSSPLVRLRMTDILPKTGF